MTGQDLTAALAQRVEREVSLLRPTRLMIESVLWRGGPAPDRFWIPENTVPLWETPEYGALTEEQRRRYNHYYAMQKIESFIWTESHLIIAPLERLLKKSVPSPSLRTLLDSFVTDERHHVATIHRLLELARPDLYKERMSYFFIPSVNFRLVTGIMTSFPRLLPSWALLICALEENTVALAHCYRQAQGAVDPLFAEICLLHAQDEGRHCKLDMIVCEWLLAGQSGVRRALNAKMLDLAFRAYFDPGWGLDIPIKHLVADFPELRGRERTLMQRTREMRSPTTAAVLLDESIAPITAKIAGRFDMLRHAIEHLVADSSH
ncbi:MAG TPA: diiron oxygenase [Alphaproteobacteria bacterium]|jgi:hypothetical protein|nr:diiron oxygenase [Alphaproteobacteria bacterium]